MQTVQYENVHYKNKTNGNFEESARTEIEIIGQVCHFNDIYSAFDTTRNMMDTLELGISRRSAEQSITCLQVKWPRGKVKVLQSYDGLALYRSV